MKTGLISIFASLGVALLVTSCGTGQAGQTGTAAVSDVLSITQAVGNYTQDAQALRTNLQQLAFKLNSYASYNAAQFQSASRAQEISAAIASVAQALSNATVINAPSEADAIKAALPYDMVQPRPFYTGPTAVMSSQWDCVIYPNIITRMIHIQASYASAMVQIISQNIQYLTPHQISSLSASIQGLVSRLSSLPA